MALKKNAETETKTEGVAEKTPNRLLGETSTYLLQHAYNPVDWYPWGPEALERARAEEKPILLSIGYAACHWCHVMEHESFEDPETASLMNARFVNIKVDREERTDLDEIYMKAVQMMTGHGGWPMTVFLTPDLAPFFAGTYFPPVDKHGMPSFKRILLGVALAWEEKRDEVVESATEITAHLKDVEKIGRKGSEADAENKLTLSRDLLYSAVDQIARTFDPRWGGFGSAPKFPHPFSLSLVMRVLTDQAASEVRRQEMSEIVETSLDRMAYGGIHDHLSGGFARYSVDRQWLIPHFEKMLYDNALLCQTYLDGFLITGRTYWKDVAKGIFSFVSSELRTPDGAFYSSLDADSEGEEGKFYVWTPATIAEVLGEADAKWFNEIYGVTKAGNFEHGTSALHLTDSPENLANKHNITVDQLWERLEPMRAKLLEKRAERIRPGRDEKVLTSWNSLMISAYVHGYRVAQEPAYLEEAITATEFLLANLTVKDGEQLRLLRTWGQGKAKLQGYLDDYSYFAQALLDLASVDADPRWLDTAICLTDAMLDRFRDENGGFYYTADDHETLLLRPKTHFDGSTPSATSVAQTVLLRLSRITADEKYEKAAESIFDVYGRYMAHVPDQFANMLCGLDLYLSTSREVVLVHPKGDKTYIEFVYALNEKFRPNQLALLKESGRDYNSDISLLANRDCIEDKPTVYVCENYTCQAPVQNREQLRSALDA